jgi:hypothetical protein
MQEVERWYEDYLRRMYEYLSFKLGGELSGEWLFFPVRSCNPELAEIPYPEDLLNLLQTHSSLPLEYLN